MTAVAKTTEPNVQQVRTLDDLPLNRAIAQLQDKFKAALPAHIPAERFVRTAINAVLKPDIEKCANTPAGRQSIYESLLKAAADGLLVDGREAALVKFIVKTDGGWEDRAQYMPMVAGIMKKARNSGEIRKICSHIVYANDLFEVRLAADVPIVHEPPRGLADRGEVMGVYALCQFKDGSWSDPEVLNVQQVNDVRKRSKTGDKGPWASDWNEMARKTAIKRAAKYWPSSTDKDGLDVAELVQRDDELTALEHTDIPAQPKPAGRKLAGAAAKALAAPKQDDEPETVIENNDDRPDDTDV